MNLNSIFNNNSYLDSLLNQSKQQSGTSTSAANATNTEASDTTQLSPFAQLLSTLQQLQQANSTEYQLVTQKIATNLQTAAQTAQSAGNTTAASRLTQLSTDFSNASSSSQVPDIQDLAQAASGEHHHGNSGAGSPGQSFDPMSIIFSTLSGAGIGNLNS